MKTFIYLFGMIAGTALLASCVPVNPDMYVLTAEISASPKDVSEAVTLSKSSAVTITAGLIHIKTSSASSLTASTFPITAVTATTAPIGATALLCDESGAILSRVPVTINDGTQVIAFSDVDIKKGTSVDYIVKFVIPSVQVSFTSQVNVTAANVSSITVTATTERNIFSGSSVGKVRTFTVQ